MSGSGSASDGATGPRAGSARVLRVLVVEDSPTVRQLLVAMLESDPAIRVVGQAENGLDAVRAAVRLTPDLITMDVNMPGQDGLAATKEIMAASPTPIIIVSSTANQHAVALSLDATQAGALMVLPKPESPLSPNFEEQRDLLVRMAKAMAQVKVVRRWGAGTTRGGSRPRGGERTARGRTGVGYPQEPAPLRLVAIGCSTGGPAALRAILRPLPPTFPVPIVVVQHMAHGFIQGLVTWLDGDNAVKVRLASQDDRLLPGTVYVAGDDRHLGVRRDGDALRAELSSLPPIGGFRPSATHLFASAARALGAEAAGVILTGMGNDGLDGLRELRSAGALVLAQDEATSVVYGMAREAVNAGVASEVLPLTGIPSRLLELVG